MKDMTKGSPFKLIILFSIPLLIGNLFQQFYNLVDTIIVGQVLGPKALAAVGTTGPLNFFILGFGNGIGAGFCVPIAQYFGAKNLNGLKKSISNGIVLTTLISLLMTLLALTISRPALELMQVPSDIIEMSLTYINYIYLGIIFSNFYNLASGTLRALGDSKTPLYVLVFASLLNVVLDILLIKYMNMGVAGASIATITSQAVSAIICYIFIFVKYSDLRLKLRDFKLDKRIVRNELSVGLPMAFQFSITAIGVIAVQRALNNFGTDYIASYTASNKIENLAMCSFIAVGTAMSTYAGQNYGAGKLERLKRGMLIGTGIELGLSLISYVMVLTCGEAFVHLFLDNPSEEVINLTKTYLKYTGCFYPTLSLIFIHRTSLQSMGDNIFPLACGFLELVCRVTSSFILPKYFGYMGIIMSGNSAWFFAGLFITIRMIFYLRHLKNNPHKFKTIEEI